MIKKQNIKTNKVKHHVFGKNQQSLSFAEWILAYSGVVDEEFFLNMDILVSLNYLFVF